MKLDRRQILQALGLGAMSTVLSAPRGARADEPAFPTRILFYVQPHGHIPSGFQMAMPGAPTDRYAERDLRNVAREEFPTTLRPLHDFRDYILPIEGTCLTSVHHDIAEIRKTGGDLNNHQVGVAGVLTGARALQRRGLYCTGGATSIDQVLAARMTGTRFGSRCYGIDYIPNSVVSPFSYLGAGQATPMVSDPKVAFDDLLGIKSQVPVDPREARLRGLRPSVLDSVRREYEILAPKLGYEGKQKLDKHQALIRDLEKSIAAAPQAAKCEAQFDGTGPLAKQFMRLARIAFSCDLTRVITFAAPVPETTELSYPADMTFHTYGHASIQGATSCGSIWSPIATQAMLDLDAWNAKHLAFLMQELASVPEGNGTLLDHTVIVWITELATPTHTLSNVWTMLAGGGNGFFKTGRYVRFPRDLISPLEGDSMHGPAHNKLLVSLMQSMGQPDNEFGLAEGRTWQGNPISFRGPLTELHRNG